MVHVKERDETEDRAEWKVTDTVLRVQKLQKLGENVIATSWVERSQHAQLPKHDTCWGKMEQKVE